MTKAQKIRLIYGIALSVLTVVVGILFVVAAADIYFSGEEGQPAYSREIVGKKLALLMIPVGIWLAAIIGGVVIWMIWPQKQKLKVKRSLRSQVEGFANRLPQDFDNEQYQAFQKAELVRLVGAGVCFAVCLVSAVLCCLYIFAARNFEAQNINLEVVTMLRHVLPWVVLALATCVLFVIFDDICAKKQLPVIKQLVAQNPQLKNDKQPNPKLAAFVKAITSKTAIWIVRGIVCAIAITFVVLGIFNGGARDVLIKAINICTECIGLG